MEAKELLEKVTDVAYRTGVADAYRQALQTVEECGLDNAKKVLLSLAEEYEAMNERDGISPIVELERLQ